MLPHFKSSIQPIPIWLITKTTIWHEKLTLNIFYIDHQDETKTGEENYQQLKTSTLQSSEQDKNWKNVHSLLKYIWTTQ